MPPYNQIHAEYFWYIILGGLVFTGLVWLAVVSRVYTLGRTIRDEREHDDKPHSFGGGLREGRGRMPIFLWLMLVLFVVWAVGYTLYSAEYFPY